MISTSKTAVLLFGLLIIFSGSLYAQSRHVSAESMGLGGGGTAYVNGYHANFVNPANLMLSDYNEPRFNLGLLGGISTSGGGPLANISVYNEYFTKGRTIANEVAVEALEKWFGNDPNYMNRAGFQFDIIPLGMSYRADNWSGSLALRSRVLTSVGMNRGLAELGMHGLDGDIFSSEQPVNMSVEGMTFAEVSVGFSMKVLSIPSLFGVFENIELFAGAAPKMLLGTNYSQIDFNSTLIIDRREDYIEELRHDFTYSFETTGSMVEQLNAYYQDRESSPDSDNPKIENYVAEPVPSDFYEIKGQGVGIDLGATAEMEVNIPFISSVFKGTEQLRVGVSLTDMGNINYNTEYGRFSADNEMVWNGFEVDQERIDEEFDGDSGEYYNYVLTDSIANGIYASFEPEDGESVKRSLPTMLNFGAHLTMNKLSLSMDFGKGFVERGINSKRVSFTTGLEYRFLGFLPLRVGMRTGGYSSTAYSAGIGISLRNFELNFAASTVPRSINHGTSAGVAWGGLAFRF